MKVIGVVCEYNPLHNGHIYQIDEIKKKFNDSLIIVITSSSFTQRGELSILSKFDKTECALECGVDIVIELPYVYSVNSSDIFAHYALKILNEFKIDYLCFGSESNNLDNLVLNANIQINNKEFNDLVKENLDKGVNYPTALNNALTSLGGCSINEANDLLALSYIKEIIKNKYNIIPYSIKRTNSYHDIYSNDKIISASNIRNKLNNNIDIKDNVPKCVYDILKNKKDNKLFEYLKYKIISEINLNKYLDVDEGLDTRIKENITKSNSMEELIQNIKTKRYTYNKIQRMLCHILCSFTKSERDITKNVEYIRLLGFNNNGKSYLNKIKKDISIPLLNSYDTKKYKALEIEKRVSNIYSLIYKDINSIEISNKPIKKED